jgi:hypothetical protein
VLRLALLPLLAAASTAAAQSLSVRDDVSVQATRSSPSNPSASYLSNRLELSIDAEEGVSARIGFAYTHDQALPSATGAVFGTSAADSVAVFVGADWEVNERLALIGDVALSPTSTQTLATSVQYSKSSAPLDAQLQSSTESVAFTVGLDVLLGQLGPGAGAGMVNGSLTVATFNITQRLTRLEQQNGAIVSGSELAKQCRSATEPALVRRCQVLVPALDGVPVTLRQVVIATGGVIPVAPSLDLSLQGELYVYNQDPNALGFFGQQGVARGVPGVALGAVPLAPLAMDVRPELRWHVGRWSVDGWYQFGLYFGGEGTSHALGAAATFRVNSIWRLTLSASATLDFLQASESTTTLSGWLSFGVRARF